MKRPRWKPRKRKSPKRSPSELAARQRRREQRRGGSSRRRRRGALPSEPAIRYA